MLTPVGPVPASGFSQTSAPDAAQPRLPSVAQGLAGERPAAAGTVLTARAVDAPRQAERAATVSGEPRRSLMPPDPNAPAGPPPAFEASIL